MRLLRCLLFASIVIQIFIYFAQPICACEQPYIHCEPGQNFYGPPGEDGRDGVNGRDCTVCPPGPKGDRGEPGDIGPAGPQGENCTCDIVGPKGADAQPCIVTKISTSVISITCPTSSAYINMSEIDTIPQFMILSKTLRINGALGVCTALEAINRLICPPGWLRLTPLYCQEIPSIVCVLDFFIGSLDTILYHYNGVATCADNFLDLEGRILCGRNFNEVS